MVKSEITIGTTWTESFVKGIVRLNDEFKGNNIRVGEFYGTMPDDVLGSVRAHGRLHKTDYDLLREHATQAHENGIKIAYANNTICLGSSYEFERRYDNILKHFENLSKAEVDSVILSIPLLMEMVDKHFPQLDIIASTVAQVDSIKKVEYYTNLGAKKIILPIDENRNFRLISNIKDFAPNLELEVLLTDTCPYGCHMRINHFSTQSHDSMTEKSCIENEFVKLYPFDRCWDMLIKNWPTEFLRSRWIRPDDISHYENVGVSHFKITGRTLPESWLLKTVEAYLNRKYEGNLLDIMAVIPGDYHKEGSRECYTLNNTLLDGFLSKFLTDGYSCKEKCLVECHYCDEWAKKLGEGEVSEL